MDITFHEVRVPHNASLVRTARAAVHTLVRRRTTERTSRAKHSKNKDFEPRHKFWWLLVTSKEFCKEGNYRAH
jgi:hypothetical protein